MRDEHYSQLGLQPPPVRINPSEGPPDLSDLVERAAQLHPDAEALVDSRERYTFSELARAIEAAAALFDASGIRCGDRIAASLPNECNLVIAFFAAMRLGAVWVGVNRILPADDKRFILGHSGAKILLTDSEIAGQVDAFRFDLHELEQVLAIDDAGRDGGWSAALASAGQGRAPRPEIDPFAPAAIMYTSGTTGVPKGVVHSQHNMVMVAAVMSAHRSLSRVCFAPFRDSRNPRRPSCASLASGCTRFFGRGCGKNHIDQ